MVNPEDPSICLWIILLDGLLALQKRGPMHEDVTFPMTRVDDILVSLEVIRSEVNVGSSMGIYAIVAKDDRHVRVLQRGISFLETSADVLHQKRHKRLMREALYEEGNRNII